MRGQRSALRSEQERGQEREEQRRSTEEREPRGLRGLYRLIMPVLLAVVLSAGAAPTQGNVGSGQVTVQAAERMPQKTTAKSSSAAKKGFEYSAVPKYSGEPYYVVHKDAPYFRLGEIKKKSFESYSELDKLGRCGVALACLGPDTLPTQERGDIGSVKPTGWQTVKYKGIDGNYLYNRCHLIAYELSAENANKRNLITGTRYMNIEGMLPMENEVARYIKSTGNHVMYRVTPVFKGKNLVASGVLMEAESVEGDEIRFCRFVYNVQPGIKIDYRTGKSSREKNGTKTTAKSDSKSSSVKYVGNTKTWKFHRTTCRYAKSMSKENKVTFSTRSQAVRAGYEACGVCKP